MIHQCLDNLFELSGIIVFLSLSYFLLKEANR
jgi:hypothetical protein